MDTFSTKYLCITVMMLHLFCVKIFSQDPQGISLDFQDQTIKTIFAEIEKKAIMSFSIMITMWI